MTMIACNFLLILKKTVRFIFEVIMNILKTSEVNGDYWSIWSLNLAMYDISKQYLT